MPTSKQDTDFAKEMSASIDEVKMSSTTLDIAIGWIQDNLEPDDIFLDKVLAAWAESNGYTKD